ncbi:MAG: sigma factor [Dehalococcoidia bacterium]|jgi:hypothetical protein
MTKRQIQTAFEQYTPMLHRLSHQCAGRCGRPEDEVYGQACYEFVRAASSFDANRNASFATYALACVRNNIAKWGMQNPPAGDPDLAPVAETPEFVRPDRQLMQKEWLAGLSDECREVAMIILNGPAEVLCLAQGAGRKAVLGTLRHYLQEERGWGLRKIWKTIREMKQVVAAM